MQESKNFINKPGVAERKYDGVKMEREKIYRTALDQWGAEVQTKMLFEEMAELQNAICKHSRGRDSVKHIAEEIADVQIMLEQMTALFGIEAAVEEYREQKLLRLADRLDSEF